MNRKQITGKQNENPQQSTTAQTKKILAASNDHALIPFKYMFCLNLRLWIYNLISTTDY